MEVLKIMATLFPDYYYIYVSNQVVYLVIIRMLFMHADNSSKTTTWLDMILDS
jgi:hypothetical protein